MLCCFDVCYVVFFFLIFCVRVTVCVCHTALKGYLAWLDLTCLQLTGDNTKGLTTSSTVAVCLHSSVPPTTSGAAVSPIKPSFSEADCHVIYAPMTKTSLSASTADEPAPPLTSISADNIVLPTRQPAGKLSKYLPFFKPPPPVGAGGGNMFSGRPSVPLSVRPCVRPCFTW